MPTGYSLLVTIVGMQIRRDDPALIAAIIAEEEGPAAFAELTRVMVFYARIDLHKECPMDAKEEKKEEYYTAMSQSEK